jgi:hypothetical protein
VILHVISGTEPGGEMERLVADIRRRTTSEIMLCSHLLTNWKAGQGDDAKTDDHKERDKSSAEIAALAAKYDCEFVDIRGEWRRYMDDNNLNSEELMYGGQNNLNTLGNVIMEMIFARHFQHNSGFPVKLANAVSEQPVKPEKDGSIKMEFHGNRIDLLPGAVGAGEKRGSARILIDGKPPSENSRLYAISVPGKPPVGFWPAIKRVSHEKPLVVEDWTLSVTDSTEHGGEFQFEVVGSVTGPDGSGNNKEKFVSKSGRAIIEPGDWAMLGNLGAILKEGRKIEISWSVLPQFLDVYTAPDIEHPALDHAVTVAQGLENRKHTLEIIPNGDGAVPIEAVRIYRPPLAE